MPDLKIAQIIEAQIFYPFFKVMEVGENTRNTNAIAAFLKKEAEAAMRVAVAKATVAAEAMKLVNAADDVLTQATEAAESLNLAALIDIHCLMAKHVSQFNLTLVAAEKIEADAAREVAATKVLLNKLSKKVRELKGYSNIWLPSVRAVLAAKT